MDGLSSCVAVLGTSEKKTFNVHTVKEQQFASLGELSGAFNLTDVSKLGILTHLNKELAVATGVSTKSRFINREGIKELLQNRIRGDDEALAAALETISQAAKGGVGPQLQQPFHLPSKLVVPSAREWYREPKFASIGRSYGLRDDDQSEELKRDLREFGIFWANDANDVRQSASWSAATITVRVQRVSTFLGFLRIAGNDGLSLGLNAFLDFDAVSAFVTWLTKCRGKVGNAIEFISTAVGVVKFLHRLSSREVTANRFGGVEIIVQLREARVKLEALERMEPKKTADDYAADSRWLDWPDFKAAVEKLDSEFNDAFVEVGECERSARLLHDLLLLRLFEASPSRNSEVRTLKYLDWKDIVSSKGRSSVSEWIASKRINVISMRKGVEWTVWLADYRSFKFHSVDETVFESKTFGPLTDCLKRFLCGGFREHLVGSGEDDQCVFVDRSGNSFATPGFAKYVGSLLKRLTDQHVTPTMLRSSFVTHLYSSPGGADPAVRESAARVLRHSAVTAKTVYDRRNPKGVKRLAQSILGSSERFEASSVDNAKKRQERDENEDVSDGPRPTKVQDILFTAGDAVVVPAADSDRFDFARVVSATAMEVTLMGLKLVDSVNRLYKPMLKNIWKAPTAACFHCLSEFKESVGMYRLISTDAEILSLATDDSD